MTQEHTPIVESEGTPPSEVEPQATTPETTPETGAEGTPPETTPEVKPKATLETGEPVEISSLQTLQLFSHKGKVYSKRRVGPDGVRALSQRGTKLIVLPPDTMVKPVI